MLRNCSIFFAIALSVIEAATPPDAGEIADAEVSINADGTQEAVLSVVNDAAPCLDNHASCPAWAEQGKCMTKSKFMRARCPESCAMCNMDLGTEQKVEGSGAGKTAEVIKRAEEYMRDIVFVKEEYKSVRTSCRLQHELCAFWASIGECEKNPTYMQLNCAPVCQTCTKVDFNVRCPRNPDAVDVFAPGDLDAMFERITDAGNAAYAKFEPTVLSRPNRGPWIVTFENFVTSEECERLIELGAVEGYVRSTDVGQRKFDGTYGSLTSNTRTSENAWCQHKCYEDPLAKRVIERIANLTGIPEKNSEYLQLLKYEVTQFYGPHHDFIPHTLDRPQGPRILTLFLYLNDVEEGGGTNFPLLNLTVMPKRGKALLWPNILSKLPNKKDGRTKHQALPVERGIKYGANAWLHMRDFKEPNAAGCT